MPGDPAIAPGTDLPEGARRHPLQFGGLESPDETEIVTPELAEGGHRRGRPEGKPSTSAEADAEETGRHR